MIVGDQLALLSPTPPVIENAVRGTRRSSASARAGCPGVNTPMPAVPVAGPDQYDTCSRAIVSAALALPVTKSVELTVTVHDALTAPRRSSTVTVPSCAPRVPSETGVPLDSDALDGAEMLSAFGGGSGASVVVV